MLNSAPESLAGGLTVQQVVGLLKGIYYKKHIKKLTPKTCVLVKLDLGTIVNGA